MKKSSKIIFAFGLGVLASLAMMSLFRSDPHDLRVYQRAGYEIWISNELAYSFPMAPYRHTVRYRKICEDSGNICSEWSMVARFDLDSPTRSSDWKFSDEGENLQIQFPEGVVVRKSGENWTTSR